VLVLMVIHNKDNDYVDVNGDDDNDHGDTNDNDRDNIKYIDEDS